MQDKTHPLAGNQHAKKKDSQKITGKGRLNIDLGTDRKNALVTLAKGGKIKDILIEIIDEGLRKRGL